MFGYVTVAKNQLTEAEYNTFFSYYCGVCRATGKTASQLSRLGLSYDITFLALVLSAVCTDEMQIKSAPCIAHPIKKRDYVCPDSVISYAAGVGVILEYLKLADDWHDEHSIKALLGMAGLWRGYRRVRRKHPEVYDQIKFRLDRLSVLEKENCGVIDEAAEEFAKITELLFVPNFIEKQEQRRVLAWLGYNLGRWIYIIDAVNDYEKDLKAGAYNPLIAAGYFDRSELELSLTITLSNIASAFELLDLKKDRDLIGKIVYISLKQKQESILNGDSTGAHQLQNDQKGSKINESV